MKKVLFIANYITFPEEKGNSRFIYILDLLKDSVDLELITSNFFHTEKKKREASSEELSKRLGYKVTLVEEPGYRKNISIKRFFSHYKLAKNIEKYLKSIEKPDVIYCSIPSLDVAKVVAKYAERNNIRFIIDVQDLWPEAFKVFFKVPIIKDIVFYPMKKQADYIYSKADDIVAVSNTYANRASTVNKKYKNKISVFLGTDLDKFDNFKTENEIILKDNLTRVVYIGTLGHSYDLKCIIDALKILKDKGINDLVFVVMGVGPLKEQFENYALSQNVNCEFTGRLEYSKMVGKLCSCDIAVNPIKKGSAGSIINKVGDYAAAGLPIINTQESKEFRKIVEDYEIGFNVSGKNIEKISEKIEELYKNEKLRIKLGKNNRKLAEEKFNRKITYIQIKKLIEEE